MPTYAELRALLDYNPNTGVLTWKPRGIARWDTRWAFKVAGGDDKHGYLQIAIHGRIYRAHRICYALAHEIDLINVPPEVDHEDGNGCNNRKRNLRASDRGTNAKNGCIRKRNTSGLKGVSWDKKTTSWRAHIMVDRAQYDQRGFSTREAAHAWYLEKAAALHKDFACGNVNGILA